MTSQDTSLHRFHQLLVEALQARDPQALQRPFTVAEIYQDLVPYRRHRDRLGVEMNGDYEHLLLRLLAGEGELVRLESEPALRAIRKELGQASPNTGIYRDYAAADVRLVAERPVAPVSWDEAPGPPPPSATESSAEPPPSGTGPASECRWCQGPLPDKPNLRFCPHCGADVRVVPCPHCQEPLEPGWRFCISCGEEVEAA